MEKETPKAVKLCIGCRCIIEPYTEEEAEERPYIMYCNSQCEEKDKH